MPNTKKTSKLSRSRARRNNWLQSTTKWQRFGALGVFVLLFAGVGAFVVQHANAASYHCVRMTLSTTQNSTNYTCVSRLQIQLNAIGVGAPISVDGDFGPKTKSKVVAFQQYANGHYGGDTSPNGVVNTASDDNGTWYMMCAVDYYHGYSYNSIGCDTDFGFAR